VAKKDERKQVDKRMRQNVSSIEVCCSYSRMADTASLKPHPKNPNRHPREQVALIAKLIETHGWRAPITISKQSGLIIRGRGRFDAAVMREWKKVPVDEQDYASSADEIADMLADNKVSELSYYDAEMERAALQELSADKYDMAATGYLDDRIAAILKADTSGEENIHPFGDTSTDKEGQGIASQWSKVRPRTDNVKVRIGDIDALITQPLFMELKTALQDAYDAKGVPVYVTLEEILKKGLAAYATEDSDS